MYLVPRSASCLSSQISYFPTSRRAPLSTKSLPPPSPSNVRQAASADAHDNDQTPPLVLSKAIRPLSTTPVRCVICLRRNGACLPRGRRAGGQTGRQTGSTEREVEGSLAQQRNDTHVVSLRLLIAHTGTYMLCALCTCPYSTVNVHT